MDVEGAWRARDPAMDVEGEGEKGDLVMDKSS